MNSSKVFLRAKSLWSEAPRMTYGMFSRRLPTRVSHIVNLVTILILQILPKSALRIIPKNFRYLLLTAANTLFVSDSQWKKVIDLSFPNKSTDLIENFLNSKAYFRDGRLPNISKLLQEVKSKPFFEQNKDLKNIIQWSFWTVNHADFHSINDQVKHYLEGFQKTGNELSKRYLPQHTSNLGHLAMLFLYINYYRKRDPSRIIVLPRENSANEYFLRLITEKSPLKIEFANADEFSTQSPTMIDTLHYSLDINGRYRTESDCAFFSSQSHPEFEIDENFTLRLSESENARGKNALQEAIGHEISWFAVLHIRESKNGILNLGQARDVNISNYEDIAKVISNEGGLLIRMGDRNFPKLKSKFEAFDYAHSNIKSEFMDVWLWANAKFWIGNVSGATFAPIPFKVPRVISDQWYFNNTLPKGDVILRKKILHNGVFQPWHEVINSRISRCMDFSEIRRAGYELKTTGKLEIEAAVLEMCRRPSQNL